MSRIIRILTISVAFITLGAVFATLAAAAVKGSETKGRYYFKKTCKDCHVKGAKGGEVTPLTKSMAQWNAYFTKAKHGPAGEPLTKVLPAEQLLDVQTFLVKHAADSLQPETCGK